MSSNRLELVIQCTETPQGPDSAVVQKLDENIRTLLTLRQAWLPHWAFWR